MRDATADSVYLRYLDERPGFVNSTAFFLDAADVLFAKGKPELALRVLSNLAEMELENRHITSAILKLLDKPETLIKPVADRQGHDRRYSLDTTKVEKLGFKCDTDFDKALRQTVQWYVENPKWWRAIKERSAEFRAYYDKQYANR